MCKADTPRKEVFVTESVFSLFYLIFLTLFIHFRKRPPKAADKVNFTEFAHLYKLTSDLCIHFLKARKSRVRTYTPTGQ